MLAKSFLVPDLRDPLCTSAGAVSCEALMPDWLSATRHILAVLVVLAVLAVSMATKTTEAARASQQLKDGVC